jgi:cephalosporin hydroxylase
MNIEVIKDRNYHKSMYSLENYVKSDIGIKNAINLHNIIESLGSNNIFVDLGVWHGFTSHIFLINSEAKNNKIYGVDISFDAADTLVVNHPKYKSIIGDSSTIGKNWQNGEVSLVFVDTCHVKEQVMCELLFWYEHVKEGGYMCFHDTNWPEDVYDNYGGINWQRPEEAIKSFFNIKDLNYEDEYIESINNADSAGMTFIKIKKKFNYKSNIKWDDVFEKRNFLINLLWFSKVPGFQVEKFDTSIL